MESSSQLPSCSEPITPTLESSTSNLESSNTSLRFPAPVTDQRVSTWVDSVFATKMPQSEAPSDEGILGESAYEFIDTDTESRDGNTTESVASTDFGRPDDVASLADTERSGEESGDDEAAGTKSVPALSALDQTVERAFNTPTIGRSSHIVVDDIDKPLAQSIEFEEPFGLGAETVSVKHTVADLNEEQTANAIKGMPLQSPPKRIVVTIRQTMTKQGLSTRDPLRILYVGSHSAKQDIIHKIASSVTASVDSGKRAQNLRHLTSQLYNVVPVSEFGSDSTPEIELMHSSGFQIKVEDCMFARSLKYEDEPEKPDVIRLNLEENFAYHSVPEEDGFIVEPHWELPHVAVFYCSDSDDAEARRTRSLARKFMSRHNVPSIVISHKQLFDKGPCMSLDQHSIHMCLESRDTNGRGTIIHQRLPIDLASFLNIDARQMNRNLAYLTGLHEPLQSSTPPPTTPKRVDTKDIEPLDLEKPSTSMVDSMKFLHDRGPAVWRAVVPVGVLILSILIGVYTSYQNNNTSSPAILLNSKVMSAGSISSTSLSTLTSSVMSATFTSSSVAVQTSTRTVTVTQSLTPSPNSLSVLPSVEFGKGPKIAPPKPSNKSVCTAEILGDREILIRIPSATKLTWLNREAISVNITRANITVETERAYSSDEGIVLLLPKKEAYGIVNVSIITNKKPRVNETFQLDFGTDASRAWQSLKDTFSSMFSDGNLAELHKDAEKKAEEAYSESRSALFHLSELAKSVMDAAASASTEIAGVAKQWSLKAAKRSAIISKVVGIRAAEAETVLRNKLESTEFTKLKDQADENLLLAQIKAKITWLKLQGNENDAKEYERKAAEALKQGYKEVRRQSAEAHARKTSRATKKEAKKTRKGGRKSKV